MALTRDALVKKGFPEVDCMAEAESLRNEWEEEYPELRSGVIKADENTLSLWRSLFIGRLLKEYRYAKFKQSGEQVESITLINTKSKYSKHCRRLERKQREKEFQQSEAKRTGNYFGSGYVREGKKVQFIDTCKEAGDDEILPNEKNPYIGMLDRDNKVGLGSLKNSKTKVVNENITPRVQFDNEREALKGYLRPHLDSKKRLGML